MADTHGWLKRDVLARSASVRPGQLAVKDLSTGGSRTYAELEAETRVVQARLAQIAERGARVAYLARNAIRHVALFYACPRAGMAFVPLNWRLSGPELAVILGDSAPDVLIYDAEFEAAAETAMGTFRPRHVFRQSRDGDAFGDSLAGVAPASASDIDPQAPGMLLYTSGTTGRPKGVIITPATGYFASNNFTFVGEFSAEHAHLCDVPLFHVVGTHAILNVTVLAGGRLYLNDRFAPAQTLRQLADPELGITHYFCVPQIAQTLVEDPAFAGADLKGLRLLTGGAPMPAELTLKLIEAGIRPGNGYGMTENGTILGVPLDPQIARAKVGSAGLPAPAIEVRLVGPDGRDVPEGEVGEIWLRGPSVTPGYWNQPEATARAFEGDWFRTGDAARRDADGFYFIVDRWKDMYITGGENVYPAEVEAALLAMPQVAEAAVVGIPDARWGECGCAFIVARAPVSCEAILAWCDGRLARYKRPAHVRFVDELPRTASGKVKKDILRAAFEAAPSTELQS